MQPRHPGPAQVGIAVPRGLRGELFEAGFRHGLAGGQLDRVEHGRASFRFGFRAAKLYLRRVRRARGILDFPQRWRVRVTVRWDE